MGRPWTAALAIALAAAVCAAGCGEPEATPAAPDTAKASDRSDVFGPPCAATLADDPPRSDTPEQLDPRTPFVQTRGQLVGSFRVRVSPTSEIDLTVLVPYENGRLVPGATVVRCRGGATSVELRTARSCQRLAKLGRDHGGARRVALRGPR